MTLFIGLLSGTSADAIDAALVEIKANKTDIVCTYSLPISDHIRNKVFSLAISSQDEITQIQVLDHALGELFSRAALDLCNKAGVDSTEVEAIGSHGQTVRHCPPGDTTPGYSLQIGDPNIIVENTGITTVADFRRRDIAAGGHGAPLAPGLHNALFRSQQVARFIVNCGGIANITYLAPGEAAIGFDTGPANGLMDSWYQRHHSHNKRSFDNNGEWANSGSVNNDLLHTLLAHPYLSLAAPKSTGREDFNLPWLEQQLTRQFDHLRAEDVQATLLDFTVTSIVNEIEKLDKGSGAEVYICGGGAHNQGLCDLLTKRLTPRAFAATDCLGIPADWVEAVAFAWMAKQTLEHKTSNLPSITGAGKEVVLGGIYL
ncbi:MAG: anhydro-N-acetylmuramic acid kinase [Pseudomonadota bacterium]